MTFDHSRCETESCNFSFGLDAVFKIRVAVVVVLIADGA